MQGGGFPNMDSGHLFFDPSCNGNMLFLGGTNSVLRGKRSILSLSEISKTRPFFTSSEVMYDEEYYEEQLPEKKRRLTAEQVHLLENTFEAENKLEPEQKSQLAKKLGLKPRQVAVWFQNRRARWKTKQLERDYDQLKSSYDSLMSDYDYILKENEKLKAKVLSLTNKLQAKEASGMPLSDQKPDNPHHADDAALFPALQPKLVTVEDRLSTGSGGSAVVDENGPQLVDSGDSYFPSDGYTGCAVPVDHGVQSEEDEVGDDGRSYFSDVFVETAAVWHYHHHHDEGEPLGWWDWSS